ncbi:MAG: hypothetical protein M0P19_07780 [Nevskia sp.]|jgi:hypothetical protein|nr:hypothetical protein [Nevskia sp.]MCK9385016.1 hypothetical protein [Nevskia sp.]
MAQRKDAAGSGLLVSPSTRHTMLFSIGHRRTPAGKLLGFSNPRICRANTRGQPRCLPKRLKSKLIQLRFRQAGMNLAGLLHIYCDALLSSLFDAD